MPPCRFVPCEGEHTGELGQLPAASLGTSGTIYAYSDKPAIDPAGEIAGFCDSTDAWLPLVCTMNVTVATEAARNLFGWMHTQAEDLFGMPFWNTEFGVTLRKALRTMRTETITVSVSQLTQGRSSSQNGFRARKSPSRRPPTSAATRKPKSITIWSGTRVASRSHPVRKRARA